jgi:hypothetical protein
MNRSDSESGYEQLVDYGIDISEMNIIDKKICLYFYLFLDKSNQRRNHDFHSIHIKRRCRFTGYEDQRVG